MKVTLFISIVGCFNTSVSASATSNEFIPCKKLAVSELAYCLEDEGKYCWDKSKASFDACYQGIVQNHNPNNVNNSAKREEREKALEALKKQ